MMRNRGFTPTLKNNIAEKRDRKPMLFLVRGFTLIEVLVVIGIIGVIASIGVANMNKARKKANDAEIIAQLSIARTTAALFFDTNLAYKEAGRPDVANNCNAPHSMFIDVVSGMYQYTLDSNYPDYADLRCSANDAEYEISAALSAPDEYWCVNYQGLSKKITASSHNQAHPNHDTDCIP